MRIDRIKSRTKWIIFFLIIKCLYDFLTVYVLQDLWYPGYGSYGIAYNPSKELVCVIFLLIMSGCFLAMKSKGTFLDSLMVMLFVLYYIPMNSSYAINNTSFSFFWKSNLYFFLFLLCVNLFIKSTPKKKDINQSTSENDLMYKMFQKPFVQIMCIVVCVFCILYKFSYNGLSFSISLENEDVYSSREAFQANMDLISGSLFSYILAIFRNLAGYVAPVYFYYSLTQRKFLGMIISTVCMLSLFALSSGKIVLMFMIVVLIIAFFRKSKVLHDFSGFFVVGLIGLLLLCGIEIIAFKSTNIFMFFVRRVMYYPAWLNSLYFDFFDQNIKVLWSQDAFLLQNILPNRYSKNILNIISNHYYMGYIPSPNTGLFAEAYMHFGNIGIFVYPILLTMLLKKAQKVFFKFGRDISILVAVKLVLQITNVSIVRTDFVLSFILFVFLMDIIPMLVFQKENKMIGNKDGKKKKYWRIIRDGRY